MPELSTRYDGKPILRLLDSYVLDAIGALDEKTVQGNAVLAPKIAQALKVDADSWQRAVELAMDLPEDSVVELRARWQQFVEASLAAGETPDPLGWSHALVDVMFGMD